MASTQALSAAAQDRKTRLAQLKSLKRKQPSDDAPPGEDTTTSASPAVETLSPSADSNSTSQYISGRNYDKDTKNARLGFDDLPSAGKETLEIRAAELASTTQQQAAEEAKSDKPLDLFALQPKKPNWDLKRDLERKLEVLNVRTENAIARLVRERIAAQKKAALAKGVEGPDGAEAAGLEGATLVEATNVREREDEEDARREREEEAEEDELLDGR